jgi:hypothetical protein
VSGTRCAMSSCPARQRTFTFIGGARLGGRSKAQAVGRTGHADRRSRSWRPTAVDIAMVAASSVESDHRGPEQGPRRNDSDHETDEGRPAERRLMAGGRYARLICGAWNESCFESGSLVVRA